MMLSVITGRLLFDETMVIGMLTSIGLLGVTGLLLVKDLDKPMRFIYVMLRPNWSSWLVRGGYALATFGLAMSCHLAVFLLDLPTGATIICTFGLTLLLASFVYLAIRRGDDEPLPERRRQV